MEKGAIVAALSATELELRIKNYSLATRKTYLTCLDAFLQTCSDIKHPSENHIKSFILKKQDKGLSSSTTNVYLQAIKFYIHNVLHSHVKLHIPLAKRPKRLPVTLTKNEILRILDTITNTKHKTLLALAYGSGGCF